MGGAHHRHVGATRSDLRRTTRTYTAATGGTTAWGRESIESTLLGLAESKLFKRAREEARRELIDAGAPRVDTATRLVGTFETLVSASTTATDRAAAATLMLDQLAAASEGRARARKREAERVEDDEAPGTAIMNVLLDPYEERTGALFDNKARAKVYGDKQALMADLQAILVTKDMANFTRACEKMEKKLKTVAKFYAKEKGGMAKAYRMEREAGGARTTVQAVLGGVRVGGRLRCGASRGVQARRGGEEEQSPRR